MQVYYSLFIVKYESYEQTIALVPAEVYNLVTVISFFVNVPVLSEHITLTQPVVIIYN